VLDIISMSSVIDSLVRLTELFLSLI